MAIITVGLNPAIDRILECPNFHIGGHQPCRQIARLAAGKAANVSRALAYLGVDSIATGFLGTREIDYFHEQLMAAGPGRILCQFVEVVGETRENVTILDPERQAETHLRDQGFTVTSRATDLMRAKLLREIHSGDIVVFSGSLCAGASPDYLGQLIDVGLHAGGRIVVDSSGDALRQVLQGKRQIWLLKPNLEELQTLLGREVPNTTAAVSNAARELLPQAQMVLVSRGAEGAVLVGNPSGLTGHDDTPLTGQVFTKGIPIRTVGCGDYLVAGFLAELQAGHSREIALRWGLCAASARAFSCDQEGFDVAGVRTNLNAVAVSPA